MTLAARFPASLVLLALVAPVDALAETPMTLVHSGYLLDAADQPVNTSALPLRFRLFKLSHSVDDEVVEWDSGPCTAVVSAGRYSVALGKDCGAGLFPSLLPIDEKRHLEVEVDGVPLSPRLLLGTVPTAALADDALRFGGRTPEALTEALTEEFDSRYARFQDAENAVAQPGDLVIGGSLQAARLSGALDVTHLEGSIPDDLLASGANLVKLDASQTLTGANTFTGAVSFAPASEGAAPFAVSSAVKVDNLNADTLDGLDSSVFATNAGLAAVEGRLEDYLPKTGGTLTGALSGTTATFSGELTAAQVRATGGVTSQSDAGLVQLEMRTAAASGTTFGLPNAGLASLRTTTPGALAIGTHEDAPVVVATKNEERLRIDGSGALAAGPFAVDPVTNTVGTSALVREFSGNISGPGNHPECTDGPTIVTLGTIRNSYYGSFIDIELYGSHRGHNTEKYFQYAKWVVMAGDHVSSVKVGSGGTNDNVDLWNGSTRGNYSNILIGEEGFPIELHVNPNCGSNFRYTYVVRYYAGAKFTPHEKRSW